MTAQEFVLGVDIGTTGCKTVAANRQGQILSEGVSYYGITAPRAGWAEQDSREIFDGALASIRQCANGIDGAPRAMCFTGALHSVMPVDARDRALLPALIWADTRSAAQAARLKLEADAHARYTRTGCPSHPMYPLAKLLWLRENAPLVFDAARRFVSLKEFVLAALTGEWRVDESVASGTGLLHLAAHNWDTSALALAGIDRTRLSPAVAATNILGTLRAEYAEQMGVPQNTRVVIGASDAALNNIGAGAVNPKTIVVMIGSSGAVRTITPAPILDTRERTWCYILDDARYMVGGAINNAGLALRWFADNFAARAAKQDVYEILLAEAETVGAGAAGLIFLPFLTGERSPNWNAEARGVLFGLSLPHQRAHVARAILEGVCYCLRSVLEAVEEVAGAAVEIRGTGGFVRSKLWTQILANVLNRPLGVQSTTNASALGAAFLGWRALGELGDWNRIAELAPVERIVEPDAAVTPTYDELYQLYQVVYAQLLTAFGEISRFQATNGARGR